ncbi:MAG: AAA family ATPase, partial [Bacteroidia bacterium]|nr:AAA family ATPase [Bacteroidia bacterium]
MANLELQLAENFALHTDENMFITGNAGTGKTTLLKKIVDNSFKNTLVAAPTGVAAINAGGVTLHSLFQLPVTSFIPADDACNPAVFTNRYMLLRHLKLSKEKITLLRELEQLIIDEASMVRSDVLDAVDFVLRAVRKNKHPFGGVQVVMIGDLHQLPPVMKDHEWETLQQFYQSPYFFDSLIWQDANPVYIELMEIFRQRDERFIRLLNNIRNREPDEDDFKLLTQRYRPHDETENHFILLTTHNYKADQVNLEKLNKTDGKLFSYLAEVKEDFPEHLFPCEKKLTLKQGARVMFMKNDTMEGQYYNGLTGTVTHLNEKEVVVTTDDGKELNVKKYTWENIKYMTNGETGKIHKEPAGTFRQYPLRLAWAVTIHKSQGLTFDKVMVDAGKSFAPGQVYVALSRCRSLEGIVLLSKITSEVLFSDSRVLEFSSYSKNNAALQSRLEDARTQYSVRQLSLIFRFE